MQAYMRDNTAERIGYSWKALSPFWAALRPDQICPELCRDYIKSRRENGIGDGTILRELSDLRAGVFRYASDKGATFQMPSQPAPRNRHLTKDEYRKLREAALSVPHLYLFLELALATGARKSAVLDLTWPQIDFDRGRIDLGIGSKGKGRSVVPMTNTVRKALIAAKQKSTTQYVIEYGGERVLNLKKAFNSAVARSGIPNTGSDRVTPHVLRHTAAVWMAEAGTKMSEIAQYLGHTNEKVTFRVYARYSPDYLRGAASALEVD